MERERPNPAAILTASLTATRPYENSMAAAGSMNPSMAPLTALAGFSKKPAWAKSLSQKTSLQQRIPHSRIPHYGIWWKLLMNPFFNVVFGILVFAAAGLAGLKTSGVYDNFVAENGTLWDFGARMLGFNIATIQIVAGEGISREEIVKATGIDTRNSLLFVDAAAVREKLLALPLYKDASVSKLYPNQLAIRLEERQPFALWQEDGEVHLIAEDGTPIAYLRDARYINLPFVVGEHANERVADYAQLLNNAGDLKSRIVAGTYVAGRRWDLKFDNNVLVKLPEKDPELALSSLNTLEREAKVLEKDVISLDFRVPSSMIVRLSDQAADDRNNSSLAKKAHVKANPT